MNTGKQNGDQNSLARRKKRHEKLPELEYLRREASSARAGMSAALGEMKRSAVHVINPLDWWRHHPWMTTGGVFGVAAILGFTAGRFFRRSRLEIRADGCDSDVKRPSFTADMFRTVPKIILTTWLSRLLAVHSPPSDTPVHEGQVEEPVAE